MDATGTLRLVFDADPWDSTISFAPGIPVALGGTLDLTFAPGVDVATQSGRTIDLFDWTGVTPTGAFTVSSPYTWNLTNLYTTGEVTLAAVPSLPGDFNHDGTVDAADYVVWRKNPGGIYTPERLQHLAHPLRPNRRHRFGCHWLRQCESHHPRTHIARVTSARRRHSVRHTPHPTRSVFAGLRPLSTVEA